MSYSLLLTLVGPPRHDVQFNATAAEKQTDHPVQSAVIDAAQPPTGAQLLLYTL